MIDVSDKDITLRTAKAEGRIVLSNKAYEVIRQGTCIKGDVFMTAKIAAIQAVKSTPMLIPMCHPVQIDAVNVDFKYDESEVSVTVTVFVKSSGRTGVEMEAICGAAAACITIYDMLKYTSKAMTISNVQLIEKTGGKSGDYKRTD